MKCIVLLVACLLSVLHRTNCLGVFENGISEDDKRLIEAIHNNYRGLISQGKVPGQPRGKYLKTIKYDENLARLAQGLSDTCVYGHNNPKDGRWHAVGQNLYKWSSTGFQTGSNWKQAVEAWFDEFKFYRYGGPIDGSNGHYTQIIWGDTEYIGCGYTFCETQGSFKYEKLYVCNYGPAGNYVGRNPYTT